MKKLTISAVMLTCCLAAIGQTIPPVPGRLCSAGFTPTCTDSQTIATSGGYIYVPNNGSWAPSFEKLVSGAPASLTVTVSGCMQGGTCDPAAITDTATASDVMSFGFSKVYYAFKITASWSGGTNPSVTINSYPSTAALHPNGGGMPIGSPASLQNTANFPSSGEERDFFGGYFGSYLRGTLANIESGANVIGIVNYFGDSMTRGDGLTSVLRNYLQTDWFDGGPGWCSANYAYGAVWPADCQLTADTGSGVPAGTWIDCVHGAGGSGCTGSYIANGPDLMTTISNDTSTPAAKRITCNNVDQMQLWYMQQPNGGSFEYSFDAAGEATTVNTAGALGLKVLDWATLHGAAIGNGTHYVNLKITAAGSGSSGDACQGSSSGAAEVCILGAYCINDIGGGVAVNKLGSDRINGGLMGDVHRK